VFAESEGSGKGTTVTLELPRQSPPATSTRPL